MGVSMGLLLLLQGLNEIRKLKVAHLALVMQKLFCMLFLLFSLTLFKPMDCRMSGSSVFQSLLKFMSTELVSLITSSSAASFFLS